MSLGKKLQPIAESYCDDSRGIWKFERFIDEGNSAAVYLIAGSSSHAALKVYDPAFFQGNEGEASIRRLEAHNKFISHDCPTLVQFFDARIFGESAIVLMEYLPWRDLSKVVSRFPDDQILSTAQQVAVAAKFLSENGVCHRDIKPENIAISDDFHRAKLLDLGVLRVTDDPEGAGSDHEGKRPFLGTVQYSSPEYLIREEPDGINIFDALTFYQLGGVLHDLIMKHELFGTEKETGNKQIVGHAVHTKTPTIQSQTVDPNIILLARHCLLKDPRQRMQLVNWDSFLKFEDHAVDQNIATLGLDSHRLAHPEQPSAAEKEANRQTLTEIAKLLLEQINLVRARHELPPMRKSQYSESYSSVVAVIEILHRDSTGSIVSVNVNFLVESEIGSDVFSISIVSQSSSNAAQILTTLPMSEHRVGIEALQDVLADAMIREYALQIENHSKGIA